MYEGLAEFGVTPNWFVGISIGAVNSAILAGNPPERRVERLRTFWDRASAFSTFEPPAWLEPLRPMMGRLNFATVATWGIPGFFKPRSLPPDLATSGSPEALSYYDTAPLKETLEELVDFDLINRGDGAPVAGRGERAHGANRSTSTTTRCASGPEHVHGQRRPAAGLPRDPDRRGVLLRRRPRVQLAPHLHRGREAPDLRAHHAGQPLQRARGLPRTLDEAMERVKDIQFASKQRFTTQKVRELQEMRAALGRLLAKLPPDLKADPDAQKLAPLCDNRDWTIVHINNRRPAQGGQYQGRRVLALRRERPLGRRPGRRPHLRRQPRLDATDGDSAGIRVFHLPPVSPETSHGTAAPVPKLAEPPETRGSKPHDDKRTRRTA